jgi:hypothetical protein
MTDKNTLQFLSQLVIRRLSKGLQSKDSRLDEREIAEALRLKLSSAVKGQWYEGKKMGEQTANPRFIGSYTVPVVNDATEKKNCIEIPVPYMFFPDGTGLWSVTPVTNNVAINRAMIPVTPEQMEIYRGTATYGVEGQFTWYALGDKIYFSKRWDKTLLENNVKNVLLKMVVVAPDSVGMTDILPISPDQREEIVSAVVADYAQLLGIMADEKNDTSTEIK